METKKLRRSVEDKVIGGVSGGLGEYFGTDPVIFRILFVVLTLTGGGGVFIYLLMWIFIPKADLRFGAQQQYSNSDKSQATNSEAEPETKTDTDTKGEETIPEAEIVEEPSPESIQRKKNGNLIGGTILILVGGFFLADDFFPWLDWEYLWPAALIIAGLAIIKINYQAKK
ncbi:MAG: PspC domain-containing protein [Bacteroidales bacterium]|nr:PspC domain-containing protein [Bacteroidales bacterium]